MNDYYDEEIWHHKLNFPSNLLRFSRACFEFHKFDHELFFDMCKINLVDKKYASTRSAAANGVDL